MRNNNNSNIGIFLSGFMFLVLGSFTVARSLILPLIILDIVLGMVVGLFCLGLGMIMVLIAYGVIE